jgi:hypothetical protein
MMHQNHGPVARKVLNVNCSDAITTDRGLRAAFHDNQALTLLAEQSGAAFDPELACGVRHLPVPALEPSA